MYIATKTEIEILKTLNKSAPLKKEQVESQIIEENCKNICSGGFIQKQIQNALEGCIAKGFAAFDSSGKYQITAEGKRQI